MRMHIHLSRSRGVATADRLMGQLEGMARRSALPTIRPAANINALYEDLLQRMAYALNELKGTHDAEWKESLHPRKFNGQFGQGDVPEAHADMEQPAKPTTTTSKGGMDKMRELFASGHSFTREELLAATGLVDRKLTDYLAMLKNPKWAGAKGALKIEKNDKGEYFVATADGKPAPPPEAPAPPVKQGVSEGELSAQVSTLRERLRKIDSMEYRNEHRAAAQRLVNGVATNISSGFASDPETAARMASDLRTAGVSLAMAEVAHEAFLRDKAAKKAAAEKADLPTPPVAPPGKYEKYVDQKTTKDAAAWAVRNGYVDKADFGKLDVSVANDYLHALGDHLAEFPMLRERNGFAGSSQAFYKDWFDRQVNKQAEAFRRQRDQGMSWWAGKTDAEIMSAAEMRVKKPKAPGKAWALAHRGHTLTDRENSAITFNEKFLTKTKMPEMNASMKRSVETRWHPPGCDTVKSIADHEIGHQLDNLLDLKSNPRVHELIKLAAMHDRGPVHQGMPVGPNVKENIKNSVSQYAATNTAEFIAEAWAEYRNNPDPRHIAVEVGNLVRSTYAQKYGPKA